MYCLRSRAPDFRREDKVPFKTWGLNRLRSQRTRQPVLSFLLARLFRAGFHTSLANAINALAYDTESLGAAAITLQGGLAAALPVLQGNYDVYLQPRFDIPTTVAIGQVGTIPNNAQSVQFYAIGSFTLSFAGHPIAVSLLQNTAYGIYGGDISAFQGQTGMLLFQGGGTLDNISFSSSPVPEPGSCTLFISGAVLLALARSRSPV